MFSFFTDNDVQRRTAINNENSVIARKPTLSARKPLSDRNTNLPKQGTPLIKLKQTPSIKLKQTPRTIVPEKPAQDDFMDFCSYKDVPDNFEDLATFDCVLEKNILDKLLGQFSKKDEIEPEPLELNLEKPKLIEKVVDINDSEILDADSIADLLKAEVNIVNDIDLDVPLPEYI